MVGSKFKHSERFSISLNQFLPFVSQNLAVDFLAQYPHKYYNGTPVSTTSPPIEPQHRSKLVF